MEAFQLPYFDVPLYDDDIYKMLARLLFNCIFVSLVVFVAFYPKQKKKTYVFIYLMMNITVFFICFTMKKMDLGLGMALGLFAIFAILRYRTDAIRIKEMTYLFVVVGIAVVNSLSNKKTSYAELMLVNFIIFILAFTLEWFFLEKRLLRQSLIYDKIELMKPKNRKRMIEDLSKRTGINIVKADVNKLNLAKGSGEVTVYYRSLNDIYEGKEEKKGEGKDKTRPKPIDSKLPPEASNPENDQL